MSKAFPDSCAVTALHRWFPIFSFETRWPFTTCVYFVRVSCRSVSV